MNDNRTAGTTTGRQNASYHHATSLQATQHREVTPRTAMRRARPALLLASLVGLMTLTSCYDYQEELLTARELDSSEIQLAFSLGQYKMNTRMSDVAVQADDENLANFRGINELYLLPFNVTSSLGNAVTEPVAAASRPLSGNVTLPRSIASGTTELYNRPNNYNNYYRFVTVPVTTDAFLCYGFGPSDTPKTDGVIVKNADIDAATVPNQISFSLKPIYNVYDNNNNKVIPEKATALVDYLNSIYLGGTGENAWTTEDAETKWNTGVLKSVKDLVFTNDAYYTAGSSANVLALVQRIYNTLYSSRSNEDVAKVIAAIEAEVSVNSDGEVTGWKTDSNLDNYPRDIDLPDGAAYIEWDDNTDAFTVITDKSNLSAAAYSVDNLVYPPSLAYFANSRIMTHQKKLTGSLEAQNSRAQYIFKNERQWGTAANYVANDNSAAHSGTTPDNGYVLDQPETTDTGSPFLFTGRSVTGSTGIVAIAKPLQYAVARLDVTLKNVGTEDEDNNVVLLDANEAPVTVTADAFPVTGIMIAGQKDVDWKFNTVTTSDAKEYTIYDSQVSTKLPAVLEGNGSVSSVIRTLAFETNPDEPIYVAVEFENNSGVDFVTGESKRIVPNGCRFYLIGQLDPANATNTDIVEHGKVLCQDQVTTVTFTVKDLKKAYNVIPDFSSRELELSLGVLDWKLSTPSSALLK